MKIDDTVSINQNFENLVIAGRSGIIKDILPNQFDQSLITYLVKFNISSDRYLHNGNGAGEYVSDANDCYWFNESEFELINTDILYSFETIKSECSLFYLKNKIDALISKFGENACYRVTDGVDDLVGMEISHGNK